MKKAMLFVLAFLFSVSANAATLSMSAFQSANATQSVDINTGSVVLGGGTVTAGSETWKSQFDVKTDVDTPVRIEWSFNPQVSFLGATLKFLNGVDPMQVINITSDFSFSAMIYAGKTALIDIVDATRSVFKYDVSVSAVPVPAALFLFAPALLGFMSLRRKNTLTA